MRLLEVVPGAAVLRRFFINLDDGFDALKVVQGLIVQNGADFVQRQHTLHMRQIPDGIV
mgnify:CR=1 FL=1